MSGTALGPSQAGTSGMRKMRRSSIPASRKNAAHFAPQVSTARQRAEDAVVEMREAARPDLDRDAAQYLVMETALAGQPPAPVAFAPRARHHGEAEAGSA